ncbi:hypothetical protein JTB14_025508 [Gonioctena quinquepunctata]|nr:hypothetical protein JTB14_025508 [Gonioctena quinquepunctata]
MWLKMESWYTLSYTITRSEIVKEIREYLQNIKALRERGSTGECVTEISKENIKWITKEIQDVKNADDFFKYFGDDYEMPEYEAILDLLKEKPRKRVVKAELEYREAKYVEILRTIQSSVAKGEFTQHVSGNMEKYENEYGLAKALHKRHNPSDWIEFKKLRAGFTKKNTQKHEKPKQTLIDTFREMQSDEDSSSKSPENFTEEGSRKGGEAGSVPRTYSMGAQPPSSNQPLDRKTKTDPMQNPTPPMGGNIGKEYEDDYFTPL